jgi:predicted GH43/DUF377 family glycosyl hydrolase
MVKNLFGKDILLHSSNPTLIEYGDHYLLNLRWINYEYHEDGSKKIIPSQWISLNSRCILNERFQPITEEHFLEEDFEKESNRSMVGIEDLRIFKHEGHYSYLATCVDPIRKVVSVSSHDYPIDSIYVLNRNLITPTFYDESIQRVEKNWTFVLYRDKCSIVYAWYPLQLCRIENQSLHLLLSKPMPKFFKDARGSTSGFQQGNEIWFILHKSQSMTRYGILYHVYQHFFAVFDLEMNLIRYSEVFKFGGKPVEFCTSFVMKGDKFMIAYSLLDTQPMISVYDSSEIKKLTWYI